MKRYCILLLLTVCVWTSALAQTLVQLKDTLPDFTYDGTPKEYYIGGLTVSGVKNYDEQMLINASGLYVGQRIKVPGDEITDAIHRYWKNAMFSNVIIQADSIVGDQIYLQVVLQQRPKVSEINYTGVRRNEKKDLEERLGLMRGSQVSPNMLNRAKTIAARYFDEKGFKNAEIRILQRDDVMGSNEVILDIDVDKKEKVKVNKIFLTGNQKLSDGAIKGRLFTPGALKKLREKSGIRNWFRPSKYTPERYKESKENLIKKYNELGYRDAEIVSDRVEPVEGKENLVDIYMDISEGQRYFLRNVEWVGNTVYSTEQLNRVLRMKKGDVYNQTLLNKRLSEDEDAVGNLYYNNGYVFYNLTPIETNIVGDSIDLEMRIYEGQQATISHVRISGNDRVYEHVVRRELRVKPGDLFNREAIMRSYREIASMGHFDPEAISPDVKPDPENGTVDINWGLTSKSNDQIEFSLGWGQTGIIGKLGLKFTNFSMKNLFTKNGIRRGILPQGEGETFSISGQTNGRYYQSYSINYLDPWFGGKRPNSLNVSAFFSRQTDVNSNYYNSAYYNNYWNSMYGYGTSGGSYYENYYDDSKYVMMLGASIGWGKRLRWPDDYFTFSASLNYTRYMLKDWQYFMIANGNCNNINLNFTLGRNSTDNAIYPRRGSELTLSLSLTPPFSLWDGLDYGSLASNSAAASYQSELQTKYRWIEYHKWKFKFRNFTALSTRQKAPVLMTRFEVGLLGSYNQSKMSPFETFYMGGDGMSGYSSSYATETIGLRGYENGSIASAGYAYSRMSLELRYPVMLETSTQIYLLGFLEGGNAWSRVQACNPFEMKRSAGLGVRVFLPMVGLIGVDWGYGFDKVTNNYGVTNKGGSNFHFVLGQEF